MNWPGYLGGFLLSSLCFLKKKPPTKVESEEEEEEGGSSDDILALTGMVSNKGAGKKQKISAFQMLDMLDDGDDEVLVHDFLETNVL